MQKKASSLPDGERSRVPVARLPRGFRFRLPIKLRADGVFLVRNRDHSYASLWLAMALASAGLFVYIELVARSFRWTSEEIADPGSPLLMDAFAVVFVGLPLVYAAYLVSTYDSMVLDLEQQTMTFTRHRLFRTRTQSFPVSRAVLAPGVLWNFREPKRTLSGWVLLNEDQPDDVIVLASHTNEEGAAEYVAGLPKEWSVIRRSDVPFAVAVLAPLGAMMPRPGGRKTASH